MTDRDERLARLAVAVAVGVLVGWAFYHRYQLLASSPYPLGIDGYYYPIQLRALLERGELAYASSPLALWLMAPLAALTDPITGAKLGAALGTAALAIPAYALGRRLGGGRAVGVLAAVLAATSAEAFYLSTEFVKQGLALTIATGYLAALPWALDAPTRRRVAIAGGLLLATALTHKTAFALALIATPLPLWMRVDARRRGQVVVAALGAAALLVIAGVLAPGRFLAARDLALLGDLFTADADWSAPVLDLGGHMLRFRYEVLVAAVLSVAALALVVVRHRGDRDRAVVVGPAAVAVLAGLPWLDAADPQGLTFRLRLMSFVPLVLCGALVAGEVLRAGQPLWRRLLPDREALAPAVVALGFAAGLLAALPSSSREGTLWVHPAMQAAVRAVDVPEDGVVIVPERHIVYMVTWYTRIPARLRPEPVPPARRWRLLPGAHLDAPLRQTLDRARVDAVPGARPRALHSGDRNGLVLVDEVTWQWILTALPDESRRRYAAWPTI